MILKELYTFTPMYGNDAIAKKAAQEWYAIFGT